MTVSSLVNGCDFSPNYTDYRYEVTRLTPHHTAMIGDAWDIARVFEPTSRQASCNYAIGVDGSIVCVVPEEYRSWCSASWDNDMRAITFELSDCDYDWNIGSATIEAYINLCVDLIQRYPSLGGCYNYTGDLDGNVTFHRWFAATACPGQHLGSWELQSYIQSEVNARLSGSKAVPVQLYASNGTDAQRWIPHHNDDGTFSLESACRRGMFLDIQWGGTANGTPLQIYKGNDSPAQRFKLIRTENPEYDPQDARPFELVPAIAEGKRMDVYGGFDANGTQVVIFDANGTNAQQWYILDNGDGTWTMASNLNGRKLMLDVKGGGR